MGLSEILILIFVFIYTAGVLVFEHIKLKRRHSEFDKAGREESEVDSEEKEK